MTMCLSDEDNVAVENDHVTVVDNTDDDVQATLTELLADSDIIDADAAGD